MNYCSCQALATMGEHLRDAAIQVDALRKESPSLLRALIWLGLHAEGVVATVNQLIADAIAADAISDAEVAEIDRARALFRINRAARTLPEHE